MKAKEFIPASKPRNFVAKNQKTAGAGAHKDKKRAEKQGDVKHKNKQYDEGVSGLSDAEYNTVARYAKSKYPAMVIAALGRNPDGSVNVRMHDTKGLGITKEFKVRFRDPEETDIKEARRLKGADLQLKLVDRQEDDDTDLDDVVTDYYFDVYQNGQKVGHAQGDSYYGELVIKTDFNREFKLDTYHDKDHPLIQQFEKFQQQGVAEGWSDAVVARRTGRPRTPYSVYIKGKKWKDFANDDHARAVMDKLKAKFAADGRDPETITIAPTDMSEGQTALEKFRKAADEREKKHSAAEKEMKARHASGKEDMKGAIDRLEKHLNNK